MVVVHGNEIFACSRAKNINEPFLANHIFSIILNEVHRPIFFVEAFDIEIYRYWFVCSLFSYWLKHPLKYYFTIHFKKLSRSYIVDLKMSTSTRLHKVQKYLQ